MGLSRATFIAIVLSIGIFLPFNLSAEQNNEGPFTDVAPHSKFAVSISYLKEKGLISGFEDGTFHPGEPVSRAQALAMILNVTQKSFIKDIHTDPAQKTKNKKAFRDVSRKDWFYELIQKSKEQGFIKGEKNGRYFRPNAKVNLAQALRILFQTSGEIIDISAKESMPKGIAEDMWYSNDIAFAASQSLILAKEDGRVFPPDGELSRGQLALLLYRFIQNKNGKEFGYGSWYGDGLSKIQVEKYRNFRELYLTAAHKTLSFDTLVRVTNMENGKYVDVVINDRGPFVTGRIIDLSKTAFAALEDPADGIISVQLEIIE